MKLHNATRLLLLSSWLLLFLLTGFATAASVTLVVPKVQSTVGNDSKVPIHIRDAQGLGPCQFDLVYDPAILELKAINESNKLSIGLFDFNLLSPGRAKLVMTGTPDKPIQGDGELLIVTFAVLTSGKSAMAIENARAWEQTPDAYEMLVVTESGELTAAGGQSLLFIAGAVLFLLGIFAWVLLRKGSASVIVRELILVLGLSSAICAHLVVEITELC
jgi:hypothetical protein